MDIKAVSGIINSESSVAMINQKNPVDFSTWMSAEINSANRNVSAAETAAVNLATGETDNLHQVMLAISRAQTSVELVVEVRNRLVESAQELMRMSV